MNKNNIDSKTLTGGFAALISILVVSAVALAISMSISLLGIGEARSSLDFKKGQETLKIAESCVEDALLRRKNDPSYTGTGANALIVGDGECSISVSPSGADKIIDVAAQVSEPSIYIKRLSVTVRTLGNSINILNFSQIP